MKRFTRSDGRGFTLIELMIATTIFSVVLLLCTFGILQVTRTYYKGVTAAKTQQTARDALDRISQAIQFSGGAITTLSDSGGSKGFCINGTRYSYLLNKQLEGSSHALVVDTPAACGSAQDLSGTVTGEELLAPHMRLAKLSVTPTGSGNNLYAVTIRVVYGDDDLLVDSTGKKGTDSGFDYTSASCSNGTGSQFCAVSELNTVVDKRIK